MDQTIAIIVLLSFALCLASVYIGTRVAMWLMSERYTDEPNKRFSSSRHISPEAYADAFERGKYKPIVKTDHDEWQAEIDSGKNQT